MTITSYMTIAEARALLNMQSSEWTDAAIQDLLDAATSQINLRTGRTWDGIHTVTDEYYDGDGGTTLYLKQVDVTALDALSIDTARTGTFTTVTVTKAKWYSYGKIELEPGKSPEVGSFTNGPQTVKISYKYGRPATVDEYPLVQRLCVLLVAQAVKMERQREDEINLLLKQLGRMNVGLA